ncbi:hypothetical protein HanXRQr2_Chr15g0704351 [Helianthus annuus]|uniref:Uncharacterized protein n=1 Tax=Helianthus annuus TaxID=4232 RepID=A0A251S9K4_HELAN|nr:hypothetical protein HanXRQr2_Chr15g0704351 [Helianthus annuus]
MSYSGSFTAQVRNLRAAATLPRHSYSPRELLVFRRSCLTLGFVSVRHLRFLIFRGQLDLFGFASVANKVIREMLGSSDDESKCNSRIKTFIYLSILN